MNSVEVRIELRPNEITYRRLYGLSGGKRTHIPDIDFLGLRDSV